MTKNHALPGKHGYSLALSAGRVELAANSSRTFEHAYSRLAVDHASLEEALRTQNAIRSAVAHDLKNSVGIIVLRTSLLLEQLADENPDPAERESLSVRGELTRILATSAHMTDLLDELLGLARLEAGHRLDLEREPMDVIALTRRVIAEFLQSREQQPIQMVTPETEMIGNWDARRLERVMRNLLSNAVKYSPDGGDISVRLERERTSAGEFLVFAVADQGLGIPESDISSIFEPFHRGANVRGRIGGTGIGLLTARQIVEEHGGTLTVESRENVGSTFTVRLPLNDRLDPEPSTTHRGAPHRAGPLLPICGSLRQTAWLRASGGN